MENSFRNCVIARLVILVTGLILAIVTAGLFAVGALPLLSALFVFTAILGGLIILAVFFSISITQPYEQIRRCVLCLGLLSFLAAVALLILSLIAIAVGVVGISIASIIFVFFLALAFWIALIGFVQYTRCIACRGCGNAA